METAYIIRNGVIIGSGTNSSLNPDSSSTYIINCTIVSETGLEIEVPNYDGDFTKIKQTIADGGKVELRTNFNSSNYILEPSRIEEDYATFNTIDKNANITIKVTEYGINDVSYIDLNSNGGATIDDAVTSTDTVWSSKKTSDEIAKVETELGEKVDYKVVVEDGTRYVEDIVTQDINTWLPNDNSSILINLKKTNGINYLNFQLLCNKQDSKNWTCIVNGAANELWKIRYVNGVRYIDELATMDKVNAGLGELCNKKIYCGEVTGTVVNGLISTSNPIGKVGNVIATIKYANGNPLGCSVTAQTTLKELNFYFRWHRESDGAEAYPPDGTEITISYMIFY